jgi:Arf-GAP/coiled-coil/ANK repeat/PH domain-containing protein
VIQDTSISAVNSLLLESTQTYFNFFSFVSRNIREAWIKAKYVERRFVKQLSIVPTSNDQSTFADHRSSRDLTVKKWSVRKLRRRPKSKDSQGGKRLPAVCETKNASTDICIKSEGSEEDRKHTKTDYCGTDSPKLEKGVSDKINETLSACSKESDCGSSNTERDLVKTEVLMFGNNFEKQPLEGSVELNSDQDSTGGEDNECIGNYINVSFAFFFIS